MNKLINWRRHFHMYPEVAYKEVESSNYIVQELKAYPELKIIRPTQTSVVAVLQGKKPGKIIGLRADFDALPILEEADIEYKSKNIGLMHACGHDFHAAMLLGAIDELYNKRESLQGTIKFIFQHAEEVQPGGASQIISTGVLDDIQVFYGSHISAVDPVGVVLSAPGSVYANADFFIIKIQGKGAHAARPQNGIDPLLTGCEIVNALNHIVSRNISSEEQAVLTVGSFHAGTADNIIPDTALIRGTVRTYNEKIQELIESRIKETAEGICKAYGATCQAEYHRGYKAVINDENLYKFFNKMAAEVLPNVKIELMQPHMGGEDFSAYSNIAPAFFSNIGAGTDLIYGHHHPKMTLDENALPIGTALYVGFANNI